MSRRREVLGSSPAPLRRPGSRNATSQLATKAGGWQEDQMRQTEEALCQTAVTARGLCLTAAGSLGTIVVTRRSLLPKRLNHSDSGKASRSSIFRLFLHSL